MLVKRGGPCGLVAAALLLPVAGRADTEAGLADFRQAQFAEAIEEWQRAQAAGDGRGALYMGVLYDAGLGVPQDYGMAAQWYRLAAQQGSAPGAFNVGVLYDSGLGVGRDRAAAAEWYGKAAARGFGRADYNLALMYEAGSGVRRSRRLALRFYAAAAAHGVAAARAHMAALGYRVAAGDAGEDDAAAAAFQKAQTMLLDRGVQAAAAAAIPLRAAAARHDPLAEYDLAYCYERGLGVPVDAVLADRWYKRAIAHARDAQLKSVAEAGARSLESRLTATERRQASVPLDAD